MLDGVHIYVWSSNFCRMLLICFDNDFEWNKMVVFSQPPLVKKGTVLLEKIWWAYLSPRIDTFIVFAASIQKLFSPGTKMTDRESCAQPAPSANRLLPAKHSRASSGRYSWKHFHQRVVQFTFAGELNATPTLISALRSMAESAYENGLSTSLKRAKV